MKNGERIGYLAYIRPSGRQICVGLIWPHLPYPSLRGRGAGMKRGLQGSFGYLVKNAKKIQVV